MAGNNPAESLVKSGLDPAGNGQPVNTISSGVNGYPVTFDGCVGIYQPGHEGVCTDTAVLFASPWGMEEMCTRKFQRVIAARLGEKGVASLRFDYPGSGDSLDGAHLPGNKADWAESVVAAVNVVKTLSGCSKLIVISQGLGCPVACEALTGQVDIEAMILMAPVISGRAYMRELAMWSSMIDDGLGLKDDQRKGGTGTIAGMRLPEEVVETYRKSNLMSLTVKPANRCLVIARSGRVAETELVSHLASIGASVDEAVFHGYDELVSTPTLSKIPYETVSNIVDWVAAISSGHPAPVHANGSLPNRSQVGDGFIEQPVQFAENGRLFGVVCEPKGSRTGATVLLLNSAYDRHAGWGRSAVEMARELARSGIASLRFDTANVADSPPVEGVAEQVLYDDAQNKDVVAAIDFIASRMPGNVVTAGRCSGAYLGFGTALEDKRIKGVIAVNPDAFRWQKGRSVDESLHKKPRSFGEYRQRFLQGSTFARLFKGDVDVVSAFTNICRASWKRIAIRTARLFRKRSDEGRRIYGAFENLKTSNTAVDLLYSENDDGLAHFGYYFDMNGRGLAAYPNVSFRIIPDADHNLSPAPARKIYLDAVKAMALRY
jgi:alpha-beta hydrolase superfamily lysophospholipase